MKLEFIQEKKLKMKRVLLQCKVCRYARKSKEIFIKSIENELTEEQEEMYELFLFKKDKNGNYNRTEKDTKILQTLK